MKIDKDISRTYLKILRSYLLQVETWKVSRISTSRFMSSNINGGQLKFITRSKVESLKCMSIDIYDENDREVCVIYFSIYNVRLINRLRKLFYYMEHKNQIDKIHEINERLKNELGTDYERLRKLKKIKSKI